MDLVALLAKSVESVTNSSEIGSSSVSSRQTSEPNILQVKIQPLLRIYWIFIINKLNRTIQIPTYSFLLFPKPK